MSSEISLETGDTPDEIIHRDNTLLNIFSEEDIRCHNLSEMKISLFNALQAEVQSNAQPLTNITPSLLKTASAFLRGEELRHAEISLVADMDSLSKDVRQKIKKGIYHVAESKQIDGNMRAVVVDKNNKIIKQITLKHSKGNQLVADDLNTLAVQAALRQITQQLECIDVGIQYLITLNRRHDFQTPYFDAVRKIIEAKSSKSKDERNERVKSAVDNLNHGLNGLYGDLNDCLKTLTGKWIPVASKRNLDYIAEDMVYIPQYVALLSYLYNFLEKEDLAMGCIQNYSREINRFVNEEIISGYTAAQLLHSHFHYSEANRDFWIDGMKKIQSEMVKFKLPAKNEASKTVYYLSLENAQGEENNA